MAEDDLRALEREAWGNDPEARARYLRQQCRVNGHQWNHYKGGDHLCKVCGHQAPPDEREPGAQTMYCSIDKAELRRLMEEEMRSYGAEPGEPGQDA